MGVSDHLPRRDQGSSDPPDAGRNARVCEANPKVRSTFTYNSLGLGPALPVTLQLVHNIVTLNRSNDGFLPYEF